MGPEAAAAVAEEADVDGISDEDCCADFCVVLDEASSCCASGESDINT